MTFIWSNRADILLISMYAFCVAFVFIFPPIFYILKSWEVESKLLVEGSASTNTDCLKQQICVVLWRPAAPRDFSSKVNNHRIYLSDYNPPQATRMHWIVTTSCSRLFISWLWTCFTGLRVPQATKVRFSVTTMCPWLFLWFLRF